MGLKWKDNRRQIQEFLGTAGGGMLRMEPLKNKNTEVAAHTHTQILNSEREDISTSKCTLDYNLNSTP